MVADIKNLIWKHKSWDEKTKPKKNFTFRVVGGEMYFSDDDMFSSLVCSSLFDPALDCKRDETV